MLRAKMIRDGHADADAFWSFSLAVYDVPEVARLCLDLQDRHHVDVNLLLFGAWFGASGRGRIEPIDYARLAEAIAPLNREVVAPLRAVRNALKPMLDQAPEFRRLRETVKATEFEAERMVQRRLVARLGAQPRAPDAGPRLADAGANVIACLVHFEITDEELRAQSVRVLTAAIAAIQGAGWSRY
jgi:uncharacterized protein (TIGR02444 family)